MTSSLHPKFSHAYKTHHAELHLTDAFQDVGSVHTEQHAEHAHQWCRLMYSLQTSMAANFEPQLARIRNRHLAAWHLRLEAPKAVAPAWQKEVEESTEFSTMRRVVQLRLRIDAHYQVVDLSSTAPLPDDVKPLLRKNWAISICIGACSGQCSPFPGIKVVLPLFLIKIGLVWENGMEKWYCHILIVLTTAKLIFRPGGPYML